MFGERVVGILVWQSGKRSSENGFQTTFSLGRKGSSLERPRVCPKAHTRLQATACSSTPPVPDPAHPQRPGRRQRRHRHHALRILRPRRHFRLSGHRPQNPPSHQPRPRLRRPRQRHPGLFGLGRLTDCTVGKINRNMNIKRSSER